MSPEVQLAVARAREDENQRKLEWAVRNDAVRLSVCPDCASGLSPATAPLLVRALDALKERERKWCATCNRKFYCYL